MRKLGIVIAVPQEAEAILADGRFAWEASGPGLYSSSSFPVKLVISGVGKVFASWALSRLLHAWEPEGGCDLVCILGTSGALGDQAVASLWLVGEFVEQDMDASALGFPRGMTPFSGMEGPVLRSMGSETRSLALSACATACLAVGEARLISGDSFIADGRRARELGELFSGSLCDMESAAVAKLCCLRAGLECFALRSVSDNADHQAQVSWTEAVKLSALDLDSFLAAFVPLLR